MNVLNKKRLGDLLVQAGKITKEQLKTVLAKQGSSGAKLGELLIQDKILNEEDIIEVLKLQLGIGRVHLDMMKLDRDAVRAVPENLAKKYGLIAFAFERNNIKVAMTDPLNLYAIDDVQIATGRQVITVIDTKLNIEKAIDKYYSSEYVEKAAEELSKSHEKLEVKQDVEEFEDVKNAPVVKLIDSVIKNAVKANASDIHIEPFENYIRIRYRVDGALQEVLRTSKDNMGSLVTRIKILASLNIAEKRIPQDGRIITKIDEQQIDLRVSSLPTVFGEKIVIRVLKKNESLINKEDMGMTCEDMDKLERIIKSPYGIILATGPTGSGKSTTLYTLLTELNSGERNIVTVENPVEYTIDGVNQVNVNTKAGMTFASGLRAILRQDPDIVMIGEIRDAETAQISVRAAITGHLVLSTIHTNDTASTIARLMDMGIESYLLASSVSGLISQRLVRKICPKCKAKYEASSYEKKMLGIDKNEELKLYKGEGCTYCNNTGYYGRKGIYEIMEITREHRDLIQDEESVDKIRDLNRSMGMKTLKKACKELVLKGQTTIEELTKVAFLKE
ncbi:GspE/PulE family protein [Clostridium ganghwense]|uniref:ATPase, T2SS/T4P/T4SS family n=1 Tax=Clostridium ganghwense TaxID=312089 RepID=A0ABT4CPD0_9CLOT|nr:type II/IV secretion system protein [Clostridium ganghwense]MCY6370914.1 ATPase, T2SS/T4P/T4SS family [Clostridium ganghwense]